jgi:hypothetical protein
MQTFLARVRHTSLHSALRATTRQVPAAQLRAELDKLAPAEGRQQLHGTGVRDEEVFAAPSILRAGPGLLGYYRLLLGISQKAFYTTATGLNPFRSMEERQEIRSDAATQLDGLCVALNAQLTVLLKSLPPTTLKDDIEQLPLLTLGAQADGSWRTTIGSRGTTDVFEAMKDIVKSQGKTYIETEASLTITNSAGREVTLALAADPDVVIREEVNESSVYKCAIEIKAGTDYSNLHNRVGEAEKSHQKAMKDGAQQCWTVISLDRADLARIATESPSTREWIDLADVLKRSGTTWDRLRNLTIAAMGI